MGHLIHATQVSSHLPARPVPAVSNERCLGRCGQDDEELQVIQGPRENQLIYKVGQGRGLKEQTFQGEGVGGEAWWDKG